MAFTTEDIRRAVDEVLGKGNENFLLESGLTPETFMELVHRISMEVSTSIISGKPYALAINDGVFAAIVAGWAVCSRLSYSGGLDG